MKHLLLLISLGFATVSAGTIEIQKGESISKAIISARRNDTLLIAPGEYRESIAMRDGITLKGKETGSVVIKGNGRDAVIKMSGESTIENLTIQGGHNGVSSQSGRARIVNCVITGNRGSGILAYKAMPEIFNTIISGNGGNGIQATTIGGGSLLIEKLTIAQNGGYGIDIESEEPISISKTVFYKNGVQAVKDRNNKVILNENVIYPEQKEYVEGNRTGKPEFIREKNVRALYVQTENSPGRGAGASLSK